MRRDNEEGAAAVEFALIAPLLFLLLFGIIAFGMGFYTQQGAAAAAREAARRAAVGGITSCYATYDSANPDFSNLENVIANAAPGSYKNTIFWDDEATHQPTLSISSPDSNGDRTVTVKIPYRVDLGLLSAFIPFLPSDPLDLNTSASAYVEQQPTGSVQSCSP